MTNRILYLFPDTNLFIQCRPLKELDWSEWEGFAEVHLLVCRSVQREIDDLKKRGNDRVGRRARKTNSLFRGIAVGEKGYELVQQSAPQVKLFLEGLSKPSEELQDRLDYNKSDDQTIGFICRFKHDNPDKDVRLLTHDTGPMMTANSLGLSFIPINESWLSPPEHNTQEREITRLTNKVNQLEHTEPTSAITCIDGQGARTDDIEIEYIVYESMTDVETSALVHSLTDHLPLATDFGSRQPSERRTPNALGPITKVYIPASDEAITAYIHQAYPAWIKDCENVLTHLHEALQRNAVQPSFSLAVENTGTRPGKDALVEIQAKGNLKICPFPVKNNGSSEQKVESGLQLPLPPQPPQGRWSPILSDFLSDTGALKLKDAFTNFFGPLAVSSIPAVNWIPAANIHRDSNAFYYKPIRPMAPIKTLSLECKQWRHGTGEEYFDGHIFFDFDSQQIKGALECRVHAENLSDPVKKTVPVTISIKRTNVTDHARAMVKDLLSQSPLTPR